MKFRSFLILLLIWSYCADAQIATKLEKRFTYQLYYQPDSTDANRVETEVFLLDLSENQSVFRSESTHIKDSVLNRDNPNKLLGTPKTQFKYIIVKKAGSNLVASYYDYTTFKFIVDKEPVDFEWELQDDSKEILGYKCRAASTMFKGRKYIAYFTDQIPLSEGPYKFKGLPGLILEIYDAKKQYHFLAISALNLRDKYDYNLSRSEGYKTISRKELKDFEKKIKEKPSLILMDPGILLSPDAYEKYDRNHRERNKSRNNPIELIDD